MTAKAISADEFIRSIADFTNLQTSIQNDLLAFYLLNHAGAHTITGTGISSIRSALHLAPYKRIASYLSEKSLKTRKSPHPRYIKLKTGYVLERAYAETLLKDYLGRPIAKTISSSLRATLAATSDPAISAYLQEAVSCFEFEQYRSSLIMAWCVAYGLFRAWIFRNHLSAFNVELSTWKSPKEIHVLEDFQELTEGIVLDTTKKIKLISKEQHKLLKRLLDDRNSYAHPTLRAITPSMTEAYIDTVLHDIIPAYG